MLRNTSATPCTCAIVTRDLSIPKLVIYPFVDQPVSMDQDRYMFFLFHDSHPRPN